jgi:protein SCO1/2
MAMAAVALVSLCGVARGQVPRYSGGPVVNEVGITPKLGEQLPLELEFVDSSGKPVRLRDCFTGRPVILHLVYYECPMLCKLSADGLFDTLATLSLEPGEDFSIVTLSFDPREKSELSARARDMAIERCGAEAVDRGWRFLTGNQPEISAVTEAVGFRYVFDEKTKQFAHAAGVFVLTPEGTISRYLSGIDYSPRDLRLAIVEASGGKVGTAGDQVLLLCYMYDPAAGKYGLAIMTVLRAAGVLTVAGMATAIVIMLRRERRKVGQALPDDAELRADGRMSGRA